MAYFEDPTRPCTGVFQPTQSDSANFSVPARQILWLADGDISIVCLDGSTTTLTRSAGETLPFPIFVTRINDTGTTLTNSQMLCGV